MLVLCIILVIVEVVIAAIAMGSGCIEGVHQVTKKRHYNDGMRSIGISSATSLVERINIICAIHLRRLLWALCSLYRKRTDR